MASRCQQNHDLVVQMAAQGATFAAIARAIKTNHHRVADYIRQQGIPYTPWTRVGAGNPNWKGGEKTDEWGYVYVKMPEHPNCDRHGYVRKHRLVMEAHIGRYLQPNEVVHHGPGGRSDNRIENLKLYGTNAEHLAETLKGQVPRWSPEGWAGMTAPRPLYAGRPTKSSRAASAADGASSPQ